MLEDFTMEKKSCGRSAQPPVKGNVAESKKNQDNTNNKVFPRSSRRREPVNSAGPRYEPNRKPTPQKNKYFDKRPRPRGQCYGSGKEDTKVAQEEEVEYGSVLMPGSKKQNLNHLLNFHYAPRDGLSPGSRNWYSSPGGWGRNHSAKWLMTTHKHKYNKEQFLQANCQFVVRSNGDYSSYMTNPDTLVCWDLIEQIQLRSSEELSCPICLYPPVAAKMTRCGHVYCWSCILHYLALTDKSWRKCPICYEAVHKQDLRSVVAVPHNNFSVGEEITLRLMKRRRGSLTALPVEQSEFYTSNKLLSLSETTMDTKYSKLLLASSKEVATIIEREKCELEAKLEASDEEQPELCFIQQALELLKERAALHRTILNIPSCIESFEKRENLYHHDLTYNTAGVQNVVDYTFQENENITLNIGVNSDSLNSEIEENIKSSDDSSNETTHRQRYESVSSEGCGSEDGGTITVEDLETPNMLQISATPGASVSKDFYFYQAADGQHIYLHALNVRMLEHLYGSLQNCPLSLSGYIVEKESGSMTEELRQRLRYLQHLPITCQFEVAEIHLKPPIVNKETLDYFQDQLEFRRRCRVRRARNERLREKRINEEENRRLGKFPVPRISINSHKQFPQCGVEENTGSSISASTVSSLGSSPSLSFDDFSPLSTGMESLDIGENRSLDPPANVNQENNSSGVSFAQMLKDGKSRLSEWPTVQNNTHKQKQCSTGKQLVCHPSDSEPEPEGYVPVPIFKQSFSDAIAHAMEKAAAAAAAQEDIQDVAVNSGKKKKKQKQKVLFATGMACIGK